MAAQGAMSRANIRHVHLQVAGPRSRLELPSWDRFVEMEKLLPLITVLVFMLGIIGVFVLAVRWARKSSKRAAFLGWGLQFLGPWGKSCAPAAGSAGGSEHAGKT